MSPGSRDDAEGWTRLLARGRSSVLAADDLVVAVVADEPSGRPDQFLVVGWAGQQPTAAAWVQSSDSTGSQGAPEFPPNPGRLAAVLC